MQVQTERGLIWVEAEYETSEEAERNGYTYTFTSERLKKNAYSKIGKNIQCRRFALCPM